MKANNTEDYAQALKHVSLILIVGFSAAGLADPAHAAAFIICVIFFGFIALLLWTAAHSSDYNVKR